MKRTYSLFVKVDGKYLRLSGMALPLDSARRIFQNMLLAGSMNGHNMNLRPAKEAFPDEVNAIRENVQKYFGS